MALPDFDRAEPTAVLAELLTGHQVAVSVDGDWLRLPRGCRARAFYVDIGPLVMQLDVVFEPWVGTPVVESCGGFGPTVGAQRADAWRTFAMGSLHVLLATLVYHETEELTRTTWEIDDLPRAVTIGDLVTRGDPPDRDRWEAAVRDLVVGSAMPEGLHWIRAYVALHEDEVLDTEVLLDNQTWDYGTETLAAFTWPKTAGAVSLRLFLVIQGGVDVSRAVADLAAGVDDDDDVVIAAMVARGVDERDAAQLVAFVPLAFGRMLLEPMGVQLAAEGVLASRATGRAQPFAFADHPLIEEATFLAGRGTLTEDQFLAVARRSFEVKIFEAHVEAGRDPAECRIGPPHIPVP